MMVNVIELELPPLVCNQTKTAPECAIWEAEIAAVTWVVEL